SFHDGHAGNAAAATSLRAHPWAIRSARRQGLAGSSREPAGIAAGCAGKSVGTGAVVGGGVASPHGSRGGESLVAIVLWHRDRRDRRRLRLARSVAHPSRVARLSGHGVFGQRLECEGATQTDRPLGHVPASLARHAGTLGARSEESITRAGTTV